MRHRWPLVRTNLRTGVTFERKRLSRFGAGRRVPRDASGHGAARSCDRLGQIVVRHAWKREGLFKDLFREKYGVEPPFSYVIGFDGAGTVGQPRDEVSARGRTEGDYHVEGDRLVFEPERLVEWDRFYGDDSSETVREPYPYGTIFDDASYELSEDELTIHYTTYPADAPVLTTMRLNRAD